MKRILISATLAFAGLAPQIANACSCIQPTVEASFDANSDVFGAVIVNKLVAGKDLFYLARVNRTAKGCQQTGTLVLLHTPSSGATCGETGLKLGEKYLINGNVTGQRWGVDVLSIHACDYNIPTSDVTEQDLDFLAKNRETCSSCPEVDPYAYGYCDMLIGYGFYQGSCAAISGCTIPEEGELFGSFEECEESCLAD